jgi:hypothetical protein
MTVELIGGEENTLAEALGAGEPETGTDELGVAVVGLGVTVVVAISTDGVSVGFGSTAAGGGRVANANRAPAAYVV